MKICKIYLTKKISHYAKKCNKPNDEIKSTSIIEPSIEILCRVAFLNNNQMKTKYTTTKQKKCVSGFKIDQKIWEQSSKLIKSIWKKKNIVDCIARNARF